MAQDDWSPPVCYEILYVLRLLNKMRYYYVTMEEGIRMDDTRGSEAVLRFYIWHQMSYVLSDVSFLF